MSKQKHDPRWGAIQTPVTFLVFVLLLAVGSLSHTQPGSAPFDSAHPGSLLADSVRSHYAVLDSSLQSAGESGHAPAGSGPPASGFPRPHLTAASLENLREQLEQLLGQFKIPGAAVALVSSDSVYFLETFGLADVEAQKPVTAHTQFCVGSCTKSFLGLGFLKLLDEERIDISTPVSEIAPDIPIDNPWSATDPVRIVHLLEHSAGFDDMRPSSLYNPDLDLPLREALLLKSDLREVRWRPGTCYSYSSPGYTLAGHLLEVVSGMAYEDYLKEVILLPIGMRSSTFRLDDVSRMQLATGYDANNQPLPYIQGYDRPASSLNSSITEMAIFVRFLLNHGRVNRHQVIDSSSIDAVGAPITTLAARSGLRDGYSFGIGMHFAEGLKWYGHVGGGPGFMARYAYAKEDGLGYVIAANKFDPGAISKISRLIRETLVGPRTPIAGPVIPLAPNRLRELSGYYEHRNPRQQLLKFVDLVFGGTTITCSRDTLYQQGFLEARGALLPVTDSCFRKPDEPEASGIFLTDAQGHCVYATANEYYVRTGGWKPYLYRGLFCGSLLLMVSAIIYALVWVPTLLYKYIRHRTGRPQHLRTRTLPLMAVLSLVVGVAGITRQPMHLMGSLTVGTVVFCAATWLFAGLSLLSLIFAVRYLTRSTPLGGRIYALMLSLACAGMTLYLGYHGIIGLRLWAY